MDEPKSQPRGESESGGLERDRIHKLTGGCSELAKEILSYLARNPEADDTLEGIVQWWLLEHRIRTRTSQVQEALAELVELGLLSRTHTSGRIRYRVDPAHRREIAELRIDEEGAP